MKKDKLFKQRLELNLKQRIATARTIIHQVAEENENYDFMHRATINHQPSSLSAFTTALVRPIKQLFAMVTSTTTKVFETSPAQSSQHIDEKSKFLVI